MNLLAITPPVYTTSDRTDSQEVLIIILACLLFIFLMVFIISICGTKSSIEEKSEDGTVHTVTRTKRHPILAVVSIVLVIVVGLILFKQCENAKSPNNNVSDSTPQLLTRSARDSDISVSYDEESMWNRRYKITPNVDIADLEITFIYLDKNRNELCSIVKTIGNVTEDTEYSVTIMSSEITFSDLLSISYWRAAVTGGNVSYFA